MKIVRESLFQGPSNEDLIKSLKQEDFTGIYVSIMKSEKEFLNREVIDALMNEVNFKSEGGKIQIGQQLIEKAIEQDDLDIVKYLIEEYNIPIVEKPTGGEDFAVLLAAQENNFEIFKYLVEKSPNIEERGHMAQAHNYADNEKIKEYIEKHFPGKKFVHSHFVPKNDPGR